MPFSKPRTKFYGCGTVYRQIASDLIRFRIHRGNEVTEFEKQAASYFGSRYAIATPLARMGIFLCLRYFLRPGQFVLQSPYTLAEVINMTVCAGGKPLFSDVDPRNAHLDPKNIAYQGNVGAMLVTHLHGIPAEMDELKAIAKEHSWPIIEDAAQSAGTKYRDRFVGTIGDAGILSFGIMKQLNGIYGGMVLTDNGELAQFIREELQKFHQIPTSTLLDKLAYLCRLHSMASNPVFSWLMFPLLRHGVLNNVEWINNLVAVQPDIFLKTQIDDWYKHRMSPCQARMLGPQLRRLEEADQIRISNAHRYLEGLTGIEGLTLPSVAPDTRATFAHFPIQVADPQNLLRWFNYYGQDIVAQHFANCAELECFREFKAECPVASRVANSLVLLPTYPGFHFSDVDRNIAILRSYFASGQPEFSRHRQLDF